MLGSVAVYLRPSPHEAVACPAERGGGADLEKVPTRWGRGRAGRAVWAGPRRSPPNELRHALRLRNWEHSGVESVVESLVLRVRRRSGKFSPDSLHVQLVFLEILWMVSALVASGTAWAPPVLRVLSWVLLPLSPSVPPCLWRGLCRECPLPSECPVYGSGDS